MTEIELFTYIVMTVSMAGFTIWLWRYVKRSERDSVKKDEHKQKPNGSEVDSETRSPSPEA